MPEFGIELVDVQFKRINYVDEVQAEGLRADDLRAQADRRALPLRRAGQGGRDRAARRSASCRAIESEAYRKAAGDHAARPTPRRPRIYADAYNRDPELYQFLKTMGTLRKTMAADTTLILSTDGEFYKFLKQSR